MACVALFSLLQTLEQIPQPVQQITSLLEKVSQLLVILEDSSQKSGPTINHLEGQIRDASYEAEDIIQSNISRQVLSRSIICGVGSCFWEMISALQNVVPAIHLCERYQGLEKVIDEFDSILEALSKIKNGRAVENLQPENTLVAGSSKIAPSNRSTPVGLDEDLLQLKDRLTGSPSKLDIISIVGMGGIGKTTLARNLYNDPLIAYHFDTRGWIVVSQEYHVQEILTGLLDSTGGGGELHRRSIGDVAELLYRSLKGRRYLIVVDDVWDTRAWNDVKIYFPDDNNGSRIILTTRLSEVAIYANSSSSIHHMRLLSSLASWDLLREKVFGEEYCPFELEEIGKRIAENCKGLPLAIIVISGLLSKGSRTRDYWENIAENVRSAVTGNDDQVMKILSFSYNSLPIHLKACFLYMGVFPEDYVIFSSQLLKLWIAEGFIKALAFKSFEEVAEDYLKDLVDRNLILIDKRNHNGGIKSCIIHDMLRELCLKKAQDEKFLQIMNPDSCIFPQGKNNQRRFCERRLNNQLLSFTMSSGLLRVLDALTIRFFEFPIELVELVHLRYLAFTYRGNYKFPASISKLRNLQTLIVYRGDFFISILNTLYLPPNIWEMPQLRHLLFDISFLPHPFPTQIMEKDSVVLENLQTLANVVNFRCTIAVFRIMPNLKKLGISYSHDTDTEWSSYEFNNFVCLRQLETLKCVFIAEHFRAKRRLPLSFAFPLSLKKLTLSGCRVPWEEMMVVGSLPNLQVLKLKDYAFEGSKWEPIEGEFRKLRVLLIDESNLEHWNADNSHYPMLQHLSLSFCYKLVEIPHEIGEIPTLELLEFYECSPSAVDSAMLIQEQQASLGNDSLRVCLNSRRDKYNSRQNTSLRRVHTVSNY